jgi:hypothetical protein
VKSRPIRISLLAKSHFLVNCENDKKKVHHLPRFATVYPGFAKYVHRLEVR